MKLFKGKKGFAVTLALGGLAIAAAIFAGVLSLPVAFILLTNQWILPLIILIVVLLLLRKVL